jgi:hypothetical protein
MEQGQQERGAAVDKVWEGQERAVWVAEGLGQAANMCVHNVEQRCSMAAVCPAFSRSVRNAAP